MNTDGNYHCPIQYTRRIYQRTTKFFSVNVCINFVKATRVRRRIESILGRKLQEAAEEEKNKKRDRHAKNLTEREREKASQPERGRERIRQTEREREGRGGGGERFVVSKADSFQYFETIIDLLYPNVLTLATGYTTGLLPAKGLNQQQITRLAHVFPRYCSVCLWLIRSATCNVSVSAYFDVCCTHYVSPTPIHPTLPIHTVV